MLFSVIIPTCHRNETLAQCLDRLAPGAQTLPFEQYEVIVTDDGAETTAEPLIRERYPWARWTQGPRRGPAANRNHGASLAQGEWLVFTDDDCLPESDWLAAYATATDEEVGALEGMIKPLGDLNQDLAECPVNLTGGLFWSANIAVRRDVFWRVGGFDERYAIAAHEDEDLQLRLRAVTTIRFVPNAVVSHPVRVLSLTRAWQRMPHEERATALYYALNGERLGIRRFTTLVRWLYKPRLVSLYHNIVRFRPRSALVEGLWLIWGNPHVLFYYLAQRYMYRNESIASSTYMS